MPNIELRQNKASMGCMLWLLGLAATGIFCFLILFRNLNFTPFKIILLLAACGLVVVVLQTRAQLKRDKPLLVFFNEGIEINETARPVLLLWQDVLYWDIRKQDATHYLIIKTPYKRHSINISWLEVQPEEVKKLMKTFVRPAAGSGNNP